MPKFSRTAALAVASVAVVGLVTACDPETSGSGSSYGSSASAPAPAASSGGAQNPAPADGGKSALQTATSATLGTIVTDGAGFTLYRFDKDTAKPPMSNCNGACATTWPPAVATDTPQLKGIDAKLVGTVTRADGSKQLTLNGWPLYRYAPDTKPGDTKGQGVGGTWFASTATGGKAAAAAPSPSASDSGYGY
ncbi:hypothetical protein AB0D08_22550 [Kitasatospora sp. NPDC048540]|uniref:hypothetical protein n=1 Tax=Kitasatospora sp. NPDC048540 TaxID=3155634 RepID=UPI0033F5431B